MNFYNNKNVYEPENDIHGLGDEWKRLTRQPGLYKVGWLFAKGAERDQGSIYIYYHTLSFTELTSM